MDKKRISIALAIAAVLILLFANVPCSNLFGLLGMLLFSGFASWEFYGLLEKGGATPSKRWGTICGLLFIASTWFHMLERISSNQLWSIFLLLLIATFFRALQQSDLKKGIENITTTLLGLIYIPLFWSFLVRLFLSGDLSKPGWAAFYVILCMKMSDSGGYFFGTRFGKHKLAPTISPKKSWEGLFGGVVFCGIVNIVWMLLSKGHLNSVIPLSPLHAIILSVLIPIVGTLGDLVESVFKRVVDAKDSNTMVYGLGGILDMIDSILFAAPMLYIYVTLFLK
jgi:phosphatidate cytidylyltransferase